MMRSFGWSGAEWQPYQSEACYGYRVAYPVIEGQREFVFQDNLGSKDTLQDRPQARGVCRDGSPVVTIAANSRFESDGLPLRCAPGQSADKAKR